MIVNFSDYSASQRYHLMTQSIIPRPIAWALTQCIEGNSQAHLNLAPFSYFTAVSSAPPLLMLSVGKKPNGDVKDTVVNTLANKKMVIHIASTKQADIVTQTAATLAHGESELELVNQDAEQLSTVPFDGFALPRLKECDLAYGCELYEVKEIGDTPQSLLFMEIKQLYINPDVMTVNEQDRITIHAEQIDPLARLGANEYAGITKPFKHSRPK